MMNDNGGLNVFYTSACSDADCQETEQGLYVSCNVCNTQQP